jgi:cell wall-associated NlpC family hydrolase
MRAASITVIAAIVAVTGLPAQAAETETLPRSATPIRGIQSFVTAGSANIPDAEVATYTVETPKLVANHWVVPAETGSAAFDTARSQIGTPYVFAGSSPSGFDCSGLVKFAFAAVGIQLPHSAGDQARLGTSIPRSEARYGDLIYMAGHIGFWAGPGLILDAPQAGGVVSIRPLWTDAYTVIRIG